nr:MAG TPA: TraP protein [Caudoviricetes sp.]
MFRIFLTISSIHVRTIIYLFLYCLRTFNWRVFYCIILVT